LAPLVAAMYIIALRARGRGAGVLLPPAARARAACRPVDDDSRMMMMIPGDSVLTLADPAWMEIEIGGSPRFRPLQPRPPTFSAFARLAPPAFAPRLPATRALGRGARRTSAASEPSVARRPGCRPSQAGKPRPKANSSGACSRLPNSSPLLTHPARRAQASARTQPPSLVHAEGLFPCAPWAAWSLSWPAQAAAGAPSPPLPQCP
jgi:hypothetical protein